MHSAHATRHPATAGILAAAVLLIGCGTSSTSAPTGPPSAAAVAVPTVAPSASSGTLIAKTSFPDMDCAAPEAKQFDFWLGDWEIAISGMGRATSGTNAVTRQGCTVFEDYAAGPARGKSAAAWVPSLKKWIQYYSSNSGFEGTYIGGFEGNAFILYISRDLVPTNTVRLVWKEISADRLVWTQETSTDGGKTWTEGGHMVYTRKKTA